MGFKSAILLFTVIMMASCKGNHKIARGPVSSNLGAKGTPKLVAVISNYYNLKNALVATNAAQVKAASQQLLSASDSMVMYLQTDTPDLITFGRYLDAIITQSKVIAGLEDANCERQRLAFSPLSNNMFELLKMTEVKNTGAYKQYCPMAFDNKGAIWLSDENEIKNPYFGEKMLECGEVTDSL